MNSARSSTRPLGTTSPIACRIVVQYPSQFFGMPHAAIRAGTADFILSVEEIAPTLVELVTQAAV